MLWIHTFVSGSASFSYPCLLTFLCVTPLKAKSVNQLNVVGLLSVPGTVRVFRQKFTLEDAIGSHACSLEASTRVTNGIPLGSSLLLPVCTVNCVQTLKVLCSQPVSKMGWRHCCPCVSVDKQLVMHGPMYGAPLSLACARFSSRSNDM
jgi:hypothetical protein